MAAEEDASEKQVMSVPPGAKSPAKMAERTAAMSASCVSTSVATRSAAAAKGMAKPQMVTSFIGALPEREAMDSATKKPARMRTSWTRTERPTSVKARACESGRVVIVLRYSVKRQAAK